MGDRPEQQHGRMIIVMLIENITRT
jgi:hypothetical protein